MDGTGRISPTWPVIPGRRIAANPESRSNDLEIPGLRQPAHPQMCNCTSGNDVLNIQRLVAAEDAILVEGDPAVAAEIGLDVGSRGDAVVQIDQAGDVALERLHAPRKGVAQPLDDLEQRKIDIGCLL